MMERGPVPDIFKPRDFIKDFIGSADMVLHDLELFCSQRPCFFKDGRRHLQFSIIMEARRQKKTFLLFFIPSIFLGHGKGLHGNSVRMVLRKGGLIIDNPLKKPGDGKHIF